MRNKMMMVGGVVGALMLAGCSSTTALEEKLDMLSQDVQAVQQGQQSNAAKIDRLAADVAEARASADRANSRLDQMGRYTK
ncbi:MULTISPECIES: LPP leucine zipper domain-containing protein [Oceanimonas]|uniref:LPP leucine zipper domain-containing protein n=1 Tax=Oceanimonas TaxID=129577 RepID=UPI0003703E4E|nr:MULTISPECIES: LPP leucine zipper domain-containing protein [Oceanimonas]MDP5291152.1 LPP leucine zipper domain-containing protein [Oceanimonas sp. CHS3-5]MDV2858404.1 LPP leucine zipper domain-containing protein [Oceanimonas sp. CAM02]